MPFHHLKKMKNRIKLLTLVFVLCNIMHAQQIPEDKKLHFAAGSIIGAAGYVWSYQKHEDKTRAMITGICLAFAAGVTKEMYDGQIKGGYVELGDIAATTLGGITWSVTIPLFQGERKYYKVKPNRKKRKPKSRGKCGR